MKNRKKTGFTLVEILLVVAVMAILGTIILGAARYIAKIAREKRADTTLAVLDTAVQRYRSEYNEWPTPGGETFRGKDNAAVFGRLRENSDDNEKEIRFFDETTLFTVDSKGKPISLAKAGDGDKPIVYVSRDGKVQYFNVTYDFDIDSAVISK